MLGTVASIYRYPVKAMAAEPLDGADVWWFGVPGDRRYAFVQSDHTGDFPWLTIRELPELTRYRPRSAADPEKDPPVITTPEGREDIYIELNKRFGSEVYNIWGSWTTWAVAHSPKVHGVFGETLSVGAGFPGLGTGHFPQALWVEG